MQSQILPVKLDPADKPRAVNLPVGDDLAAADEKGGLKSITLRVQFVSRAPDDEIELHVNGEVVTPESAGFSTGLDYVSAQAETVSPRRQRADISGHCRRNRGQREYRNPFHRVGRGLPRVS